jgi:hypothetical protein
MKHEARALATKQRARQKLAKRKARAKKLWASSRRPHIRPIRPEANQKRRESNPIQSNQKTTTKKNFPSLGRED